MTILGGGVSDIWYMSKIPHNKTLFLIGGKIK